MAFRINFNINPKPIQLEIKGMQQVPASDHEKLRNRDKADQHPIGAITGLDEALKKSQETAAAAQKAAEEAKTAAGGIIDDHSKLKNRDAADQHPMEAISGLEDAIDGLKETDNTLTETTEVLKKSIEEVEPDALSNTEIDDLWKSIM